MKIKCTNAATRALGVVVNGVRVDVKFNKRHTADVAKIVGEYLIKEFNGIEAVGKPKETENE